MRGFRAPDGSASTCNICVGDHYIHDLIEDTCDEIEKEYLRQTSALDLFTTVITASQTHHFPRLRLKTPPHPHIKHISDAFFHKQQNFASSIPSVTLPPSIVQQRVNQIAHENVFNLIPSVSTNPAHYSVVVDPCPVSNLSLIPRSVDRTVFANLSENTMRWDLNKLCFEILI